MNFGTIARWEFKNTLKSRKFLLIFFLQLSVLGLMIIVFNSFALNIESDKGLSITPSLTDFATVDVDDQGGLFQRRINPEIINIQSSNYNNALERLNAGKTTGFFVVSPDSLDKVRQGEALETALYLDYNDPRRSVVNEEINNTNKAVSDALVQSYLASAIPKNQSQNQSTQIGIKEETTGESLPLQIIRKVMLAVLLFLPLFLFGNMVIDSVVGEKERKTGEILIAMPLSHVDILLGKGLAVTATMALQVAMWVIILLGAGFAMQNVFLVYLMVVLTALPVVGLTTIIAAYAKNYKEAGIGISFAYIFVVGFLIVPALAYVSQKSVSANISPMTIVMRLFSGESVKVPEIMMAIFFMIILTFVTFWIAAWLFRRDDVLFGPRPGPITLILQMIGIKRR